MLGGLGTLGGYPYEGAFCTPPRDRGNAPAFSNPYPSIPAQAGAWVAAVGGIPLGRFAWADPATGLVVNPRLSPSQHQGIVIPVAPFWTRSFWQGGVLYGRQGLPLTLFARGSFWLRFAGGAWAGNPVYASLVDGTAISGQAANSESTPFVVASNCLPGQLAQVSSWATFGD